MSFSILLLVFIIADPCAPLERQVAVTPLSLSHVETDISTAASDWISAALSGEQ
jgi:hypothetical protein